MGVPPARSSARSASSIVSTATTFMLPAFDRASLYSYDGTSMSLAPARRAVIAFCFTPPTGPTVPSSLIAPVTATFSPPVRLPGVSWSMIASVNASPAYGPLTRCVSMATVNGMR